MSFPVAPARDLHRDRAVAGARVVLRGVERGQQRLEGELGRRAGAAEHENRDQHGDPGTAAAALAPLLDRPVGAPARAVGSPWTTSESDISVTCRRPPFRSPPVRPVAGPGRRAPRAPAPTPARRRGRTAGSPPPPPGRRRPVPAPRHPRITQASDAPTPCSTSRRRAAPAPVRPPARRSSAYWRAACCRSTLVAATASAGSPTTTSSSLPFSATSSAIRSRSDRGPWRAPDGLDRGRDRPAGSLRATPTRTLPDVDADAARRVAHRAAQRPAVTRSPTACSSRSSASPIRAGSVPPPWATSGLPPPPPPSTAGRRPAPGRRPRRPSGGPRRWSRRRPPAGPWPRRRRRRPRAGRRHPAADVERERAQVVRRRPRRRRG